MWVRNTAEAISEGGSGSTPMGSSTCGAVVMFPSCPPAMHHAGAHNEQDDHECKKNQHVVRSNEPVGGSDHYSPLLTSRDEKAGDCRPASLVGGGDSKYTEEIKATESITTSTSSASGWTWL